MAAEYYVSDCKSGLTLADGDAVYVLPGGTIVDTTLNTNGAASLSSGAIASETTINAFGALHVFSGATAEETTVNQNGYFGVGLGATVKKTTIGSAGALTVWGGGLAISNTINEQGALTLSSGAAADYSVINSGGGLHVFSGAAASNTTVNQGGYFGVGLGASVYNTTIGYAGALTVWGGGLAQSNTIADKGSIILSSGAVADFSVINSGGGLHVFSGAVASNTTVNQGGYFGVGLGASTFNTTIGYAGSLTVWGGGVVEENTIDTWGSLILSSGAVANKTLINRNGGLHIFDGATAFSTEIARGASLGIGLGGHLYSAELHRDASMTFYDGSKVSGWLDISGTVTVNGTLDAAGSYFNFDISDYFQVDSPLLNSCAAAAGAVISVEVGNYQNRGSYAIAGEAASLSGTAITLYNNSNAVLGTLTVDSGSLAVNGAVYSLTTVNGVLTLNVAYEAEYNAVIYQTPTGQPIDYGTALSGKTVANQILLVRHGGTAANNTVTNGGFILAVDGGSVSQTVLNGGHGSASNGFFRDTVVQNGYLTVLDSGMVKNTTVSSGGMLIASNGGTAEDTVVQTGAAIEANGGTLQNTVVSSGVYLRAYNNGSLINTTILDGANMVVEETGNALITTVSSGGAITVHSNGKAENIQLYAGAAAYVSVGANIKALECIGEEVKMQLSFDSKTNIQFTSDGVSYNIINGYIDGILANAQTWLEVYDGGVVRNFKTSGYIEPYAHGHGGAMQLYSNASAFDVENHLSGQVNVHKGAYLSNATADTEAEIYLSGGSADNLTMSNEGYLWVHSGGYARTVRLNTSGKLTISSGGIASGVIISGGHAIVEENTAYLSNTILQKGGIIQVCGGNANGVVISSGGIMTFSSSFTIMDGPEKISLNGQGRDITISEGGLLAVQYTGSATRVTASSGAEIQVSSSSELLDLNALNGAYITMENGGSLKNAEIRSGARIDIKKGANAVNVNIHDGANVNAEFYAGMNFTGSIQSANFQNDTNSILSGYYVSSGSLQVHAGAGCDFLTVGKSGLAVFDENTTISNLTILDGGEVSFDGTALTSAHISEGALSLSGTASADHVLLDGKDADLWVIGAKASNVIISSGMATFSNGAEAVSVSTWKDIHFRSGAKGKQVQVYGGYTNVSAGASIDGVTVHDSASVINAGALKSVTISSGGILAMQKGSVDGIQVNGGAEFQISSGATAKDLTALDDSYVNMGGNAGVSGLVLSSGARLDISDKVSVSGLQIHDGATVNLTFKQGTELSGSVNGKIFQTTNLQGLAGYCVSSGSMEIHSGAKAADLTVAESGSLILQNGAYAGDLLLSNGGAVEMRKATLNGAVVKDATLSIVNSAADAKNIVLDHSLALLWGNGGMIDGLTVKDGTAVIDKKTAVANLKAYDLVEFKSGTTGNTVEVYDGYVNVSAGAVVSDLDIFNGGSVINLGNLFDVAVSSGGVLAMQAGSASGVQVQGGAQLQIYNGAAVKNLTAFNAAYINAAEGAAISSAEISSGAQLDVLNQASVSGLQIRDGAKVNLVFKQGTSFNGSAYGKNFQTVGYELRGYTVKNASLELSTGTSADDLSIQTSGSCVVKAGASVSDLSIGNNGIAEICGTSLSGATVAEGTLTLNNASLISENITLNHSKAFLWGFGGTINGLNVRFGTAILDKSATVSGLQSYGQTEFRAGTSGTNITVCSGYTTAAAGTTLTNVNVTGGGFVTEGNVNSLTLSDGNALFKSGSVLTGIDLSGNGFLVTMAAGSTVTGKIKITEGAVLCAEDGANIVIDATNLTAGNTEAVISGMEFIGGGSVSVSVKNTNASGRYTLGSFDNKAFYYTQDVSLVVDGVVRGTMTAGGSSVNWDGKSYQLLMESGNLKLDILSGGALDARADSALDLCMAAPELSGSCALTDDLLRQDPFKGILA